MLSGNTSKAGDDGESPDESFLLLRARAPNFENTKALFENTKTHLFSSAISTEMYLVNFQPG